MEYLLNYLLIPFFFAPLEILLPVLFFLILFPLIINSRGTLILYSVIILALAFGLSFYAYIINTGQGFSGLGRAVTYGFSADVILAHLLGLFVRYCRKRYQAEKLQDPPL